jgi:hypothetical protein
VTVKGTGGDLLQALALLNSALLFPSSLSFQQTYRLYPGKRYVEIETTVTNKTVGMHPLPYLEPAKLRDAGIKIPGVENLQFSVPMGQLLLFGGEQKIYAPGQAGFDVRNAIEDSYAVAQGFPATPGLVVDYVATKGAGVSYGLTMPDQPSNYVQSLAARYAPQKVIKTSLLLPFNYAGVTAAFTANPPPVLAAGQSFTFQSYFMVGTGDAASILETVQQIRGTAVGEVTGIIRDVRSQQPIGDASIVILTTAGEAVTQAVTNAQGAFRATLPPGDYRYRVVSNSRATTAPASFFVTAAEKTSLVVELEPPASLAVAVIDENGRRAPCKLTLVADFDASQRGKEGRTFLFDLTLGESTRPTAFDGTTQYIEQQWSVADGTLLADTKPGRYMLYVSRGPQYEVARVPVDLRAGQFVNQEIQLRRAFANDGWIAGDFHLHAQSSTDSNLSLNDRVVSCAAEGLQVAVATDHNFVTDYRPAIAAANLDQWLLGLAGVELTTFESGHFNGYPLRPDASSTRGGEFLWTRQTPQSMFDQLRNQLAQDNQPAIVQVNHPRQTALGYFAQYSLDSETAETYAPTGVAGVFAPYGDEFSSDKFSYDFDAIELMTGKASQYNHTFVAPDPLPAGPFPDPQPVAGEVVRTADGRPKFPGVVDTWFTMLDHGLRPTGMGTSDSHGVLQEEPGYARTMLFVGKGKDSPGQVSQTDVVAAIRNHRTIATTAPLLEMTVADAQIGDTVKVDSRVVVKVKVSAPSWAPVETIRLYSNSVVVGQQTIPSSQGTSYQAEFTIMLSKDSWLVAEATGSKNLFPVVTPLEQPGLDAEVLIKALSTGLDLGELPVASKLKPPVTHTVVPYAITNPIWLDLDGGGWQSPKPALPNAPAGRKTTAAPDVRATFEHAKALKNTTSRVIEAMP